MLLEFISRVASFDLPWFVQLVMGNLFLLFAFWATMHIFMSGKNVLKGFVLLCFMIWFWMDFAAASGAVLFVSGFLAVYYISKIALLAFAESMPQFSKKLIILSELQFVALFVLYNVFVGA